MENTHRRGIRPILSLHEEFAEADRRKASRSRIAWAVAPFFALGALAAYLFCCSGCAGLIPGDSTTPSQECRYHDEQFIAWQAVGMAASSLSAATATGGIVSEVVGDSEGAVIGLSVSGAVLGALAVVGSLLSGHHASRYGEECNGPVSGETPP